MTEILCKWLNEEVKLSKQIEKASVAETFASGYYLGEILHKFQLQNDFDAFSMGQTADAKLNNFTRLEPTLHLLQIPFDTNLAYDIMMLKHGVATRLLYQLYVAIQRKVKNNLTGAAMETMRASAPVKLQNIESGLYKERLKVLVPREADLTLKRVSSQFLAKGELQDKKAMEERYKEMQAYQLVKQEQRKASIEKSRITRQKQTELLAKIQAANILIPQPPPVKSLKALNQKRETRRKKEAMATSINIENFEMSLKKLVAPTSSHDDDETDRGDGSVESSMEYLQRIKNRLEEDSTAREERAKRRRKVLVDQMKAHHAQEEALRQEQVVQRLMRQSQQERRIAVQLMQTRCEKDTIRKNRIFQEKQNEARRLKDFQEALDKEAELCRQARKDYEEELKREKELHERIMSEEAHNRYRAHYDVCHDTLCSILDFSCKIAEYRELTEKKVPDKLVREWRELVLAGLPLYVESDGNKQAVLDMSREELLDNQDFAEYKNMVGEWSPQEDAAVKPPPANNNILGHILHRIFSIVAPTPPSTPPPVFPEFSVRAAVIGKMFSGKSTALARLCQNHRIVCLSVDKLLAAAVESFQVIELDTTAPLHSAMSLEALAQVTSVTMDGNAPGIDNIDSAQLLESDVWEGDEKRDAEKEVTYDEEGNEIASKPTEPRYSLRAKLGKQAMGYLKKGLPVPDSILVDVIVEAIRKIPDGTGWVLDGFPTTVQQAITFEKALTGKDVSETPPTKRKGSKKSIIVSDPKPAKKLPPVVSGIDVVIVLDLNDELVLKRAYGRTEAKQANELYHAEFRPPPLGSQTGHGNTEQVVPVKDVAFDKEQVQQRLSQFHKNVGALEKLYDEVSIVRHVDADHDSHTVYSDLELCLFDTLDKIQAKRDAEKAPQKESESEVAKAAQTPPILPTSTPPLPIEGMDTPRSGSDSSKKSKPSSENVKSPKGSGRGRKKSETVDKGAGKSRSRIDSGKSPKGKKKSRSPSPIIHPEPAVEEPVGPPQPQPGDADWVYVSEELPHPLVNALVPYWENTENNYLKMTKFTFRQIRFERENIIRYLYNIRKDFREHLKRPDHKQIFVSAWQKDYNEVTDDLRKDEELKAELHQRLDDLRERLWDICDTRKEQVETERANLMNEGWMEDHLGVLTNHHLTLMQAEVDRFQDTVHVLKDYYGGMQAKTPGEIGPASNFHRMPLVELDVGGQELSASHSAATIGSDPSVSPQASQLKAVKKGSEEVINENDGVSLMASGSRTKIPLVQRGAVMGTQPGDDAVKGKKGKAAAAPPQGSESPTGDENLEEKTVVEAYNFALNIITTTVHSRVSEKEAEEEEEKRLKEEEARAKANLVPPDKKGGGKKGGGKSAKGKKGKGGKSKSPTPTPPTPVEEESEEDKRKRETTIRLRAEYLAALFQEEAGVKDRLELIKNRANLTLGDLHTKSDRTFMDMNDWLGARYLREMAAVDALSTFARHHIEEGESLKRELRLHQDEFVVNSERKVVSSPPPPLRPPAVETTQADIFTIVQLHNLFSQFKEVAPGGMIINKAFVELLADVAALTHGLDALPDMWMNISYSQLLDLCGHLAPQSEYIDWRKFLLLAAQPWPRPTCEQLLSVRDAFVEVDVAGNGWITKDQYDLVDLWFLTREDSRPQSPEDPEEPYPYNRGRNLKDFFFTVFADWEQLPSRLDYVNMLIYFAADKDNLIGVFNALSIASGQIMPKFTRSAEVQAPDKEISPEDAIAFELPLDLHSSYKRFYIELEPSPSPTITTDVWWLVLHHGSSRLGDSHRFSMSEDPEEKYSMEKLRQVYSELGSADGSALPIQILVRHSVLQDAIASAKRHRLPDIRLIFVQQTLQALESDEQQSSDVV